MSNNLIPKAINQLLDKQFFIPNYQRGYRWTKLQVEQLLDDIDSFSPREITAETKTFYCLQPVVVKLMYEKNKPEKNNLVGDWYEVIDGQQRLTTIYIILQYINQKWQGEDKIPQFKLDYETRESCVPFLSSLKVNADNTVDINKTNIDFFHISQAMQTIREWQLNYVSKKNKVFNQASFQSTFFEYSKIIWYEVSQEEKSRLLFERLNLGKIPLTNAELIKALFLSSESFKSLPQEERKIKQFEIARLWDEIEHKLNEEDLKFWSFITNKKRENFNTKIELILDLIAGKSDDEKDSFYTFLNFTNKQKEGLFQGNKDVLSDIWKEIEHFYFTMLDWYSTKNYYHKIGYLVAAKHFGDFKGVNLGSLVKDSMKDTKEDFEEKIDKLIQSSVLVEMTELRYETHYNQIFNVLLLFNIETNRVSDAISEFYPFKQHKGSFWSLEHIHARNSENFDKSKKEPWQKWLDLHLTILQELLHTTEGENNKLKIEEVIIKINRDNNATLSWDRFEILFKEVNNIFTLDPENMDRESEGISNLALLSQPDNSALNNSVFEIKRREIIRLDKKGSFIPLCTRRAFMKYYNEDGLNSQYFFWSETDRKNYLSTIENVLEKYLPINHIDEDYGNE
ncbi:hypothetical protein B0A58_13545 [Flavobacterium branchiophilum NBRC 15030 = ATCC 35035]|uniref:Uncharacterized protein DUF262 n=1 Tax=Flavobacterium branchiophilum TaxID=55197 RepID=A0A543G605_9FLAO|nr:DUF262 domain-containing protein [Flavobacterium branchiophilum]OXA71683.1 hypothetical protein B0A58_13545 [Flavobacterium branchiophilum NBRC 15030 = ATCC 35035]TQM41511.1 uncharacterized protein DUF262 [Flavobacterium branchiophilum]GEM55953.1 hypothetical protein FB1_21740 [Flavobacterium branchiophilum NBRC 15030 = ATCC 35035]